MDGRISLVTLGVADLARSVAFYRDGLGWPYSPNSNESIAFFNSAGTILALYPYHLLAEDAQVPPDGSGFRGFTLAQNQARKEQVDAVLEQAVAAGGKLVKKAQDVFWGGYSGYFADPDGYLWEIAWNPFWPLDEHGVPQYGG